MIEVKNNLTIARAGERGGKREEGFSGTTIKDTWTKPSKGGRRVWLGWGVGNADNCN